jgi:hypothetical protein
MASHPGDVAQLIETTADAALATSWTGTVTAIRLTHADDTEARTARTVSAK